MSKYLFHGSYTTEGLRGVMSEGGSGRFEAAQEALASVGGTLEAFYFALGDDDFYIIVDLPDDVSATAVSFVGNVSGSFSVRTVKLLTPEEVDRAAATSIAFRPPGAIAR